MNRKSRKSRKIRKISLVLGIAVAALAVGVPTALAEGRMVGTQEPNGVAFFKANEMSTLSQQNVPSRDSSAQRACEALRCPAASVAARSRSDRGLGTYPDASERGLSS